MEGQQGWPGGKLDAAEGGEEEWGVVRACVAAYGFYSVCGGIGVVKCVAAFAATSLVTRLRA